MLREHLDRRGFMGVASTAAVAVAGAGSVSALAQDEPVQPEEGTPEAGTPEAREAGTSVTPEPLGDPVPPEFGVATNWAAENLDLRNTRNVQGSSITSENVDQLEIAWRLPVTTSGAYGSMTAAPTIVGSTLYLQDIQSNVYALDKESGESLWTNMYTADTVGPNGVGAGYGMIAFSTGYDGEIVAVDGESGAEVWRTTILGPLGEGITMSPLIYDSTVYVSTVPASHEGGYLGGQRGVFYALDLNDGRVIWYWETTTESLWGNSRVNSGGGLWHPPSIDADGNLYVGVANASPYPGTADFPAGSSRPGDNAYTNDLVRLDPATGGVDWFVKVKPHDLFDLDNHLSPVLGDVEVDGTATPVAFSSGKHGIVVAANQETGEELWRVPVGKHMNDDLQELPADEYVEVLPGTLGGVETPMAFADGVLYVPVYNMSSYYSATEMDPTSIDITKTTGQLVALDGATGNVLWDVEQPSGLLAGATVVNDLVFTGALDGVVRAYGTADGTLAWSWQAGAGLNAPFAVSGDYLYVPAGGPFIASSDTEDPAPESAQELIAFRLGGTGTPAA